MCSRRVCPLCFCLSGPLVTIRLAATGGAMNQSESTPLLTMRRKTRFASRRSGHDEHRMEHNGPNPSTHGRFPIRQDALHEWGNIAHRVSGVKGKVCLMTLVGVTLARTRVAYRELSRALGVCCVIAFTFLTQFKRFVRRTMGATGTVNCTRASYLEASLLACELVPI